MSAIDLLESVNAISDVVANRPKPLREFDQIFMKTADMLLQAEHVSHYFSGRRVIFIGDGDAISLCLVHLHHKGIFCERPTKIHVMDFDERVVNSVKHFAQHIGVEGVITAELYNAADPLPEEHWQSFDAFYTNPPYGSKNGGKSIEVFIRRGFEAMCEDAVGCIVIADDDAYDWTQDVLFQTQKFVLENLFVVSDLLPRFHNYHLDDAPELTSCSMIIRRRKGPLGEYGSAAIAFEERENFYGTDAPLRVHYVRDLTDGGKLGYTDYTTEPFAD